MEFNLQQFPFSRYGAYISTTLGNDGKTFMIHNCHKMFGGEFVATFVFTDRQGNEVTPVVTATQEHVLVQTENAKAEIIIHTDSSIPVRAEKLLAAFLEHSYVDGQFISRQSGTHKFDENSMCLLKVMPLVIAKYLPKEITEQLIRQLKEEFLTPYGLATENVHSEKYVEAGYWRGPIWAPVMYLLSDSLKKQDMKTLQ